MKMSKRAETALKRSIKKWEKIVGGIDDDNGARNCKLCQLYWGKSDCVLCPVYKFTQKKGCKGTPYENWQEHHSRRHDSRNPPYEIKCRYCTVLAKKELAFLKSLLPKQEKTK